MAVQAYDLDGHHGGVALICTTSDRPINVPIYAFADADEAERFLAWLADQGRDVRTEDDPDRAIGEWRVALETLVCACGHKYGRHGTVIPDCCDECDGDCTGFEASA